MISQTSTRFGQAIRAIGRQKYNHASISFDSGLNEMYSFARKRYRAALSCGFVRENMVRFTMRKRRRVEVVIFRIPMTEADIAAIREIAHVIEQDKEFIYNLFSVITYPFTKGISTYKAFTCIEFTLFLLQCIGMEFDRPLCSYRPDELIDIFQEYICYKGDLLGYRSDSTADDGYFAPLSIGDVRDSAYVVMRLFSRLIFKSHDTAFVIPALSYKPRKAIKSKSGVRV